MAVDRNVSVSENGLLFIKGVLLELVHNLMDFGSVLQDTTVWSTTLTKISISRIYRQLSKSA